MPLSLPAVVSASFFWLFILLPFWRHRLHRKPRLNASAHAINHIVENNHELQHVARITRRELADLLVRLGINSDEQASANWIYSPAQRVVIALFCLANQITTRRARQVFGWAANSVSINFHSFIDAVNANLGDPASRQCSSHFCQLCLLHSLTRFRLHVCLSDASILHARMDSC
jgi:hypothetical protein